MPRLDLHLHSIHSDGRKSPEWVVQQAAANGAELIALTDHDTLSGVAEAQAEGRRRKVEVVAGVEIGVNDPDLGELHVLGYFSDDAPLHDFEAQLTAYRTERESRAERTVERLAELGLDIDFEAVARHADGGSIGRPHIARALVEAGHVESVQEAFDRFLRNDGPAYVARTLLSLRDSVAMIHAGGGFASLAHPTRYDGFGSGRHWRLRRRAATGWRFTIATTGLRRWRTAISSPGGWGWFRPSDPTFTACTRTSCAQAAFRFQNRLRSNCLRS